MELMNCDVFCTKPFAFDGKVRITGNFFSSAPVCGALLEAGEGIHINSYTEIGTILSLGSVRIIAPYIQFQRLYAEDGITIISANHGKTFEDILFGDDADSCEHHGPDGEYEPVS